MKLITNTKKTALLFMAALFLLMAPITPVFAAVDDTNAGGTKAKGEGFFTGRGLVYESEPLNSPKNCEKYDKQLKELKEASDSSVNEIVKKTSGNGGYKGVGAMISDYINQLAENTLQNIVKFSANGDCKSGFHLGIWLYTAATSIDITGNAQLLTWFTSFSIIGFIIASAAFVQSSVVLLVTGSIADPAYLVPHILKFVFTFFVIYNMPYLIQDVVVITNWFIDWLMSAQITFEVTKGGA